MNVFSLLSFMLFGILAGPLHAEAACSIQNRVDLANAGYSKGEINGLCEQDAASTAPPRIMQILSGEGQARWSQWCKTPQGSCPLNPALGYYPVGAPCNCYMPWGFYSGMAQ